MSETESDSSRRRGQSHLLGIAVLLLVTMASIGALTATVGTVVDSNAAVSDVDRVATGFDDAIDPGAGTGAHSGSVTSIDGRLKTDKRSVRIFLGEEAVIDHETEALVYDRGEYTVTAFGGAIVRDHAGSQTLTRPPLVSVSDSVVVFGVIDLDVSWGATVEPTATTHTLSSTISNRRVIENGAGEWTIAFQTPTPEPWAEAFAARGASVQVGQFEGDDMQSVIATFEGNRTAHVVVHQIEMEVHDG